MQVYADGGKLLQPDAGGAAPTPAEIVPVGLYDTNIPDYVSGVPRCRPSTCPCTPCSMPCVAAAHFAMSRHAAVIPEEQSASLLRKHSSVAHTRED